MAYALEDLKDMMDEAAFKAEAQKKHEAIYIPRHVTNSYKVIPVISGISESTTKAIYRMNSLGSLFYFNAVTLNKTKLQRNPDISKNLHMQMCLAVEKDGIQDVIEIPRDHFKSTIYSEGFAMWRALPFTAQDELLFRKMGYDDNFIAWMYRAHRQNYRWLIISEVIKNAVKLGVKISSHYENNQIFRWVFNDIIPDSSCTWTADSLHHKRTSDSAGHGEGTYDFLGVGAALQSRHYDGTIQDDLVGKEALKSPTVMEDTIDYHRLLVGAFDADVTDSERDNEELIVGNRWAWNDLNSHVRANESYFNFTTHSALGGCCRLHPYGTPIFPEAFSLQKLERWKHRLGSYLFSCFPADAPVLMYDLSEKNISELKVGDWITGYDTDSRIKLIPAQVEYVNMQEKEIFEYQIAAPTGIRIIQCTEDHKFLRTSHRDRGLYRALTIGEEVVSVYTPTEDITPEQQRDFDWLGGIFDGEGSCTQTNVFICQSPEANPEVYDAISSTLKRLGIDYNFESASNQFVLRGGKSLIVRILKHARMYKKERFIKRFWLRNGRVGETGRGDCVVLTKRSLGTMPVYNIQSSSGNYVAYGFATKNCQFLNVPINPAEVKFKKSDLRYFHFAQEENAATIITGTDSEGTKTKKRAVIKHHVHEGDVITDVLPRNLRRFMIVDPNHAEQNGRCRHAITVTGVMDSPDRRVYLLDVWAEASSIQKLIKTMFHLATDVWKLDEIWLETIAAQRYLKYHLDFEIAMSDNPKVKRLRIKELKTPKTANAKQMRIDGLGPIIERHELWVNTHGQSEFMEEFESYPNGKLRDVLDTLGYGPQVWGFEADEEEIGDEILERKARWERETRVA